MGGGLARCLRAVLCPAAFAICLFSMPAGTEAALSSFEPNDTVAQASGPLSAGQSYEAGLTPADRDFFFFYVTAEGAPAAELTLSNLGGGTQESTIEFSVVDGLETPITTQPFIRPGEQRTLAATLAPGKYFVEITSNQGSGDSYLLTARAAPGVFAPYAEIADRCSEADGKRQAARAGAMHAQGSYQRAVARRRRSLYAGSLARRKARRAQNMARARLASARQRLRAAIATRGLWCSIPQ
jgi:hypothetical protein